MDENSLFNHKVDKPGDAHYTPLVNGREQKLGVVPVAPYGSGPKPPKDFSPEPSEVPKEDPKRSDIYRHLKEVIQKLIEADSKKLLGVNGKIPVAPSHPASDRARQLEDENRALVRVIARLQAENDKLRGF